MLKHAALGTGLLSLIVFGLYLYAFTELKQKFQTHGQVDGFKLFIDGVVIDSYHPDPAIVLNRVYLHGLPWQILQGLEQYISIAKAEIDADKILDNKVSWPFYSTSVEITDIHFKKSIFNQNITFSGTAKQSAETPLLIDFASDNENQLISGKAEIRLENHQARMIDIEFDEINTQSPLFSAKRGTGWLSFSYEDNWQMVGELDAGLALFGQDQLSDSTVKLTGGVVQPDITFSGTFENTPIVIDRRNGSYYIRQDEETTQLQTSNQPFQQIAATLDQFKAKKIAEQALLEQRQIAEENKKRGTEQLKLAQEKENKEKLKENIVQKIQPVSLPESSLQELTANTSLAGFNYQTPLVRIQQPCMGQTGNCWVARGHGGLFSYNSDAPPLYFLQMANYEQVKLLRIALLDFKVQMITVQGRNQTAEKILLKGVTAQNQPAEIQLAVLGLE